MEFIIPITKITIWGFVLGVCLGAFFKLVVLPLYAKKRRKEKMTTLYLITECEYYDGEEHCYNRLSWYQPKPVKREDYSLEVKEATFEDVTIDMMIQSIEGELENANYHGMVDMPSWLVKHLSNHIPEQKIKKIIWDMIQDKGLMWGEFR